MFELALPNRAATRARCFPTETTDRQSLAQRTPTAPRSADRYRATGSTRALDSSRRNSWGADRARAYLRCRNCRRWVRYIPRRCTCDKRRESPRSDRCNRGLIELDGPVRQCQVGPYRRFRLGCFSSPEDTPEMSLPRHRSPRWRRRQARRRCPPWKGLRFSRRCRRPRRAHRLHELPHHERPHRRSRNRPRSRAGTRSAPMSVPALHDLRPATSRHRNIALPMSTNAPRTVRSLRSAVRTKCERNTDSCREGWGLGSLSPRV